MSLPALSYIVLLLPVVFKVVGNVPPVQTLCFILDYDELKDKQVQSEP